MGTDDFEEIFYGHSAGYGQGHFGNQIIGAAAEELGSQHMVFLVRKYFHVSPFIGDETFGIAAHDHPACLEGKTLFFGLIFGNPNRCDFRNGVDALGHQAMSMARFFPAMAAAAAFPSASAAWASWMPPQTMSPIA